MIFFFLPGLNFELVIVCLFFKKKLGNIRKWVLILFIEVGFCGNGWCGIYVSGNGCEKLGVVLIGPAISSNCL